MRSHVPRVKDLTVIAEHCPYRVSGCILCGVDWIFFPDLLFCQHAPIQVAKTRCGQRWVESILNELMIELIFESIFHEYLDVKINNYSENRFARDTLVDLAYLFLIRKVI